MQRIPTPAQVRKFRYSDEFATLSALELCGRKEVYEHLADTDWDAYEAARDANAWKCDFIEEKKREAKAKCEALDKADNEAFAKDHNHPLLYMSAEQNADLSVEEGVFEQGSLSYFWAVLNSHDGLTA